MNRRYNIPTRAAWEGEQIPEEKTRLERVIILAIERAVKSSGERRLEIVAGEIAPQENSSELFEGIVNLTS